MAGWLGVFLWPNSSKGRIVPDALAGYRTSRRVKEPAKKGALRDRSMEKGRQQPVQMRGGAGNGTQGAVACPRNSNESLGQQ